MGTGLLARIQAKREELAGSLPASLRARQASMGAKRGQALHEFLLAGEYRRAVEIGTCVGIGAAYICSGLKEPAEFYTLEGVDAKADVAEKVLTELAPAYVVWEVIRGTFGETLPRVLRSLSPVDFVYLDGDHGWGPTVRNFEWAVTSMRPGGVILCDDLTNDAQMRRAHKDIRACTRVAREFKIGGCHAFAIK